MGTPYLDNLDYLVTLNTPEFSHFSGSLFYLWGRDENFFEWSAADIKYLTLTADWRPTDQLRVSAQYQTAGLRPAVGRHQRGKPAHPAPRGRIPALSRDLLPRRRRVRRRPP